MTVDYKELKKETLDLKDNLSDVHSETMAPEAYEPIKTATAIDLCANIADEDTDQSTPNKDAEKEDGGDDMLHTLLTTLSLIEVPMSEPSTPGIKYLMEDYEEDMQINELRLKKSKTQSQAKKNVK